MSTRNVDFQVVATNFEAILAEHGRDVEETIKRMRSLRDEGDCRTFLRYYEKYRMGEREKCSKRISQSIINALSRLGIDASSCEIVEKNRGLGKYGFDYFVKYMKLSNKESEIQKKFMRGMDVNRFLALHARNCAFKGKRGDFVFCVDVICRNSDGETTFEFGTAFKSLINSQHPEVDSMSYQPYVGSVTMTDSNNLTFVGAPLARHPFFTPLLISLNFESVYSRYLRGLMHGSADMNKYIYTTPIILAHHSGPEDEFQRRVGIFERAQFSLRMQDAIHWLLDGKLNSRMGRAVEQSTSPLISDTEWFNE